MGAIEMALLTIMAIWALTLCYMYPINCAYQCHRQPYEIKHIIMLPKLGPKDLGYITRLRSQLVRGRARILPMYNSKAWKYFGFESST